MRRAGVLAAAVVVVTVVVVLASACSGPPALPGAQPAAPARPGNPFAYAPSREADFVARATAGSAHVLFTKSPGGAAATAARVVAFRPLIDSATAGSGIDPSLLEAIVFVESAGRPQVIAGADPAAAAGLTQIVAQTGQSLLGMHIDLARSRQLTGAIGVAAAAGQTAVVARMERRRAAVDDRFDPRRALAATVRYLRIADGHFGRPDLDAESYHMGIGNLEDVLAAYGASAPVPYAQLYFDSAPDDHPRAYSLLASFGDDSSLYYWKLLAAEQIMRLYRRAPGVLASLASLQTATDSAAEVLHPPDRTSSFADPIALRNAYANRTIVPLPSNGQSLGLAYDPGIGSLAHQLNVGPALYRGLRPVALELLIEMAARVRALSGGAAPLIVASAVTDHRYQQQLSTRDPLAASGWSFTIARRYVSTAQAGALGAMLDRLQELNLIAWERFPAVIEVTVASDAGRAIAGGV